MNSDLGVRGTLSSIVRRSGSRGRVGISSAGGLGGATVRVSSSGGLGEARVGGSSNGFLREAAGGVSWAGGLGPA